MTPSIFLWRGAPTPYSPGDTIAVAMARAGLDDLGRDPTGAELRYFCGIGACQGCLVRVGGRVVEACLTKVTDDLSVAALEDDDGR